VAPILLGCPVCRKRVSSSAHSCPHCGELLSDEWEETGRRRHKWKQIGGTIVLVPLLVVVFFVGSAVIIGIHKGATSAVTRSSYSAATKEGNAVPSIPTAKNNPPIPPTEQPPPGRIAASNIVKSRNAVVCDTLDKAQIVYELVQANQQEKAGAIDGCWLIHKGREVMVLNVAGEYAWVAPLDSLTERAWTNVFWLDPK
jgi:hypothetical protein